MLNIYVIRIHFKNKKYSTRIMNVKCMLWSYQEHKYIDGNYTVNTVQQL